jgi:hypothetical protein
VIQARRWLLVVVALVMLSMGCTETSVAREPAPQELPTAEPTVIGGGCAGGKPSQGGVRFEATRRAGEYVLEINDDPWDDDVPPVITKLPLTAAQWTELVELVRTDELRSWNPSDTPHADCQTCSVRIDDHRGSYCGRLDGRDRGAALRRRLESLARAGGWAR